MYEMPQRAWEPHKPHHLCMGSARDADITHKKEVHVS